MLIMMWCAHHAMPLEGELRIVQVQGTDNSYTFDTSEMWCQSGNDDATNQKDNCQETWQTILTSDTH